jgi:transcriptional regulator with XRE-family HTH domain
MCGLSSVSLERDIPRGYAQPMARHRTAEPHPLGKIFGANLRDWRERRGWTPEEFARRLGIKQGSFSDYERGRRGIPEGPTLLRFANVLNAEDLPLDAPRCLIDDLLDRVDAKYDEARRVRYKSDARTTILEAPMVPIHDTGAEAQSERHLLRAPDTIGDYDAQEADLATPYEALTRAIADLTAVAKRLARGQAPMDRVGGSGQPSRDSRRRGPHHLKHPAKPKTKRS